MAYSEEDRSIQLLEVTQREALNLLESLMDAADKDHTHDMDLCEFQNLLEMPTMIKFLRTQGVDADEATALYMRLSDGAQFNVPTSEFVHILARMKGSAQSIDLQALMFCTAQMDHRLTKMASDHASALAHIERIMQALEHRGF